MIVSNFISCFLLKEKFWAYSKQFTTYYMHPITYILWYTYVQTIKWTVSHSELNHFQSHQLRMQVSSGLSWEQIYLSLDIVYLRKSVTLKFSIYNAQGQILKLIQSCINILFNVNITFIIKNPNRNTFLGSNSLQQTINWYILWKTSVSGRQTVSEQSNLPCNQYYCCYRLTFLHD